MTERFLLHTNLINDMAAARSACGFCCREALRAQNRLIYEASHYQHYPTCVRLRCGAKQAAVSIQDALVTAIEDRHPRASTHLLVIPRQHIPSVDDLTPEHLDLRMCMKSDLCTDYCVENRHE